MIPAMGGLPQSDRPLTGPLLVWLIVQLGALALGAAGVPLSARDVLPVEALSFEVMLVTQAGVAALLWPWAFGDVRRGVAVIATALPFTLAAGLLSATQPNEVLAAALLLIVWLASLALMPASCGPLTTTITRAALVLFAAGGAIATYLRAEFIATPDELTIGPVAWMLSKNSGFFGSFSWICSGALVLFAVSARIVVNARASRTTGQPHHDGGGNGVHVSDQLP